MSNDLQPPPPLRRAGLSIALGTVAIFVIAAASVFCRQWLLGERFAGNFDRLNGGSLPVRIFEMRSLQAGGHVPSWCDDIFMGLNLRAHGGINGGWSPLSWIYAHVPADWFLPAAALVAALLLAVAMLGAYAALRKLGSQTLPAAAGAICYGCGTLFTLRLAQGEGFAYNLVALPWLFFVVAGTFDRRPATTLSALGIILYALLNYSFLQETAYLWLGLAAFALVESWTRRSPRPLTYLIIATACAAIAAAPRLIEVQHELSLLQRTPHGLVNESTSFEATYAQQNLTSREFARFFADGIFGRFPSEAADLGNNINLNEGFQVYSSTFASLLILAALALILIPGSQPDPGSPKNQRGRLIYAAVMTVGISAAVLTKTGLHILYYLFLGIDFSHGRLVVAALFPLAMLVTFGLEFGLPQPDGGSGRRWILPAMLAAVMAVGTLWCLDRLKDRIYDPPRIDITSSILPQLRVLLTDNRGQLGIPEGGRASRIQPRVIALTWNPVPGAEVEIEMKRDAGVFATMGRTASNRYTIGDIDPVAKYCFRLRSLRQSEVSAYSEEFVATLYQPDARNEGLNVAPTWAHSGVVAYFGSALAVFSLWLTALVALRSNTAARRWLVQFMAVLIVTEALTGMAFRLNGPQTRTFPSPFFKDNLFNSPAGTLNPPSAGARRLLQDRLERDHYRTVLLEPADQFYSTTLHVPMSWDLRTLQGGWSGVPRRLAALPWPTGIVSMRRLIFRPDTDLPWALLAKLNVKYALTVDTDLYFNRWPAGPTAADMVGLKIVENPLPVVPREFFTTRTVPAEVFQPTLGILGELPADPVAESAVEGMTTTREWPVAGRIDARYAGDRISLAFDAAPAARFLVLNELYHPDWQARTSDGRLLKIYPVNTVMRGIEVPPGVSRLVLEFHPFPGETLTFMLKLVGALLLVGVCASLHWRQRSTATRLPGARKSWLPLVTALTYLPRRLSREWLAVLAAYLLIYGTLLLTTNGYPYVLDNNESYSSWWHARSLYENGVAHTKGLTDEVFSTAPAASPYVHSHQGNLPRLFTFLLYALGCRSIGLQIWITTFTVGLAGIYFAFRFLAGLANPRFAALACLVMMTNYLLFAQWQVSLYNVWHVFFFFSSLLCVRALGHPEHQRRWALLALLNFAAFFYWEYVFTAYVTILAGLYALVLYWRRPLTLLRVWFLEAGGAALAGTLLLAQLTAYMGWDNMREDVRLTLTARNNVADPALLERVTSFYREHGIIFWHNFLDAAPLRTLAAFWASLSQHHLEYYTSPLVLAMFLIGLGWLFGLWHPRPGVQGRRSPTGKWNPASGLKWLGLTVLLGWLIPGVFPPENVPSLQSPAIWLGAAALSLLLGRVWLGGWWAWSRLSWMRFIPLGLFTLAAGWLTGPRVDLPGPSFQQSLAAAAGWSDWGLPSQFILPGAMLLALSLAGPGSGQLLGSARAARLARLPLFLLCGLLAYAATYRLFTGYVYSGYLHRLVPMLVFLTDLLLALAIYAAIRPLDRFFHRRPAPGLPADPSLPRAVTLLFSLLLSALLVMQWFRLQAGYATVVPPDSYSFLSRLEKPPFKGRSLVSNTYPAPMAARTGAWGYADTSIFSGRVTLTPRGFETERDLKYLWFADRETNPAYLKPDLAITVIQTPNLSVAMQLKRERAAAPPGTQPLAESPGLVQRAHPLQQAFLQHQLAYSDGNHVSIVRLDWDYPPFLRPDLPRFLPAVDALTLPEKLNLSESAQNLRRRWRVILTPLAPATDAPVTIALREASVDGHPLFSAGELAAAGWQLPPGAAASSGGMSWQSGPLPPRPLTTVIEGGLVHLNFRRGPHAGKIRVEVNDIAEVLDLHAAVADEQKYAFSSANPHGRHTYIPAFAPGLCVQTLLWPQPAGSFAELRYHFAHQENATEDSSIVRLYHEIAEGRWQLADTITFLGSRGLPVRLGEFQRENPDTVSEYARIVRAGDTRTYPQWLADFLTLHPAEWSRAGIVPEALGPASSLPAATDEPVVSRRIPLPAAGPGRWHLSVTPGTRTKSGPEYFGLPFALPAEQPVTVEFKPRPPAAAAPLAFGRIKMRLRFPANRWPQSEPLVTTGDREAGDFIYVYYVDPGHIRIGYDHWFKGGPLSLPIPLDFTREHQLEISLGSLFPSREDVVFAHASAAGVASVKDRVTVTLDGQPVISTTAESYETGPDTVTVGRNAIHGTLCGPEFTGEILSIERVWPDIK
jgi:hypothetical protein